MFFLKKRNVELKVADLSPRHSGKQSATDGTKLDLNIGFQGLALIQGQIYNPKNPILVTLRIRFSPQRPDRRHFEDPTKPPLR